MKTVSYKDPYDPVPVIVQLEDDDAEGLEEILAFLDDDARIVQNQEHKEKHHTKYHLEGLVYEGMDYASKKDMLDSIVVQDERCSIDGWLRESLTPTQYERFRLYMDRVPIREIARRVGADYSSVNESIKAAQKKLQKKCRDTPSKVPFSCPYYGEDTPQTKRKEERPDV